MIGLSEVQKEVKLEFRTVPRILIALKIEYILPHAYGKLIYLSFVSRFIGSNSRDCK